ncbi:unnamed protein product [Cylicostephanus goldi]|uniref:PB1 domain-containing protein n=1 Tax=Cylicostephanus goldi TaxID=71465 RepID=A0A3P6SP76_CYLGO|nr:unnamed protein product [Cylicostephanus goldi]
MQDREAALAGKLTGKQLFLRDATLSLSDVALIEQSVEIDESLFDEASSFCNLQNVGYHAVSSISLCILKWSDTNNTHPHPPYACTINAFFAAGISKSTFKHSANERPFFEVKSKFDSEWRRFSLTPSNPEVHSYDSFRGLVEKLHHLESVPFTLCYNAACGDLLPITNDEASLQCACTDYLSKLPRYYSGMLST